MISFAADIRIYVKLEGIDFRCGLNRLVPLAKSCFASDVRERAVFVFRNKARTDIKLIFFDRNGFFLGHKRLSQGKLQWWPRTAEECSNLKADELLRLLAGVDPRGNFHPTWSDIVESQRKIKHHDQDRRSPWPEGSSFTERPQL